MAFREVVGDSIRGLHPAYFSLVMATGIVSIATALKAGPRCRWR